MELPAGYRHLETTAAAAVARIPAGARIGMALGVGQPPALLRALADRAASGEVGGLRVYYLLATAIAGRTILAPPLRHAIRPVSLFHSAIDRAWDQALPADDAVDLIPTPFSAAPHVLSHLVDADVLLATVSPPDATGHVSLGTNTDYALALAHSARLVLLEINRHMPRVAGNCQVPLSRASAVIRHDAPLLEIPAVPPRPADLAIGAHIAALARDGDCLQMGIGAVPDAVCAALAGHRHLGIHTELLPPGLAALMRAGVVDNSRKSLHVGKTVFTFAMGDAAHYAWMNDNPALEAHPVDYTNDPGVIARNPNLLSVNATLEIDLSGACNSEFCQGRQYSAAGGQHDFVRGATASPGGRSVIACHATAAGGRVSRIVPRLSGPVTVPRNDIDHVATEFGLVRLRGKTLRERARALIGLAHPDFRDALEAAARGGFPD